MTAQAHQPVMLDAVVDHLQNGSGDYVDATFGRGGHASALLDRLDRECRLFVIDRDPDAVMAARELAERDPRVQVHAGAFATIVPRIPELGVHCLRGALFDLGVSSPQLDTPHRGFSFAHDGPLDMRMDPTAGVTAAEWLNAADESDIEWVLRRYGEERAAARIARAIVAARPIETTAQLASVVSAQKPYLGGKHPATLVFQALRIQVNNELQELTLGLEEAYRQLCAGGRLVVVSFHSLEDRIVKRFFKRMASEQPLPRRLPVTSAERRPASGRIVAGPLRADEAEVQRNPRARSAVLRVLEKVA